MEIVLRRKKRTYKIASAWKQSVVFMVLLSIVFGMDSSEKSSKPSTLPDAAHSTNPAQGSTTQPNSDTNEASGIEGKTEDNTETDFHINRENLNSLAQTYKKGEDKPQSSPKEYTTLCIDYMPYSFQKIASETYMNIQAKNIIIYAEYCTHCGILEDDVVDKDSFLELLNTMGISCSGSIQYSPILNKAYLQTVWDDSCNVIKQIIATNPVEKDVHVIVLDSASLNVADSETSTQCPLSDIQYIAFESFRIYMENVKEIQTIIKTFQEKHDMISSHAHYKRIYIRGDDKSPIDVEFLTELFSFLGKRIKIDVLFFYNLRLKSLDAINNQKQSSSNIALPRFKFISKQMGFFGTEIEPITSIYANYMHSYVDMLYIDCNLINEQDLVDFLCRQELEKHFSNISLANSFKSIYAIYKNFNKINPTIQNNLSIILNNLTKPIKMNDLYNFIFTSSYMLSSHFLNNFKTDFKKTTSIVGEDIPSNERYCQILFGDTVEKAQKELQDVSQSVTTIVKMKIVMLNYSNTRAFAKSEDVLKFFEELGRVFTELEVIEIYNLRIFNETTTTNPKPFPSKIWRENPRNNIRLVQLYKFVLVDTNGKEVMKKDKDILLFGTLQPKTPLPMLTA
ncbi:hypothetical protein NEFER03_2237 [Nematocida sp. LUAm3]|nr:hypothetical protein NEFER03_2237 [Nematocida sp. LUAm3]KAI5176460.1 hypothetical protein NEFER02_2212 [Nematocida sp. LUAm2]KAI5179337.1 hypothetical protein NEFER01_2180 [Nematocida sp. LUAm1]